MLLSTNARTLARTLVVAVLTALLTLTAGAAHADGVPPVFGGGTGTSGTPAPGTPTPGDTGTSGSTGTPNPAPDGSVWVYGSLNLDKNHWQGHHYIDFDGRAVNIPYSCPPRGINGDKDWFAVSVWWKTSMDPKTGAQTSSVVVECRYPAQPDDTPITCAAKATVGITKERGMIGERLPVRLASQSETTPWAADRESVTKCAASEAGVYTSVTLDETGGFLLRAVASVYPCTQRTYYDGRPSRIVGCGARRDRTTTKKIGIHCTGTGFVRDTSGSAWNHDWSFAACTGQGRLIDCVTYDRAPRLMGRPAGRAPFKVMDDGVARPLVFPALKVSGLVAGPKAVTTRLKVSGSPWRSGSQADADDQPFAADHRFARTAGDQTRWGMRWFAAGVAGDPWTAVKESTFEGRARVTVTVVKQVDIYGTVTYGSATRTVPVYATCTTGAAEVDVHRARGASR